MKSLYSILGVGPDATPDQIEFAYAEQLTRLKAEEGQQGGDIQIQLVAVKEAYSILSNPVARQRYNNKLLSAGMPGTPSTVQTASFESSDSGGTRKILLVGVIVLAGIGLYSYNVREREQLRIKHEREVQMKALQLAEERQMQQAAEQEARAERQRQIDAYSREQAQRIENERYLREIENRQRTSAREEEQRALREKNERLRQERDAEAQRRREMADAQRRVMRDKQYLQQLERDRYGRVITY